VTTEPTVRIQPPNQEVNGLPICLDQRVLPGELGEAQRDQELAGEHGGPGPDERRAARAEAEEEQLEHAGHDRDVAESRGERGEQPEGAVEFLLVAERGQFVDVRVRHRHGSSPSARYRSTIWNNSSTI
jgi:hypothetical protein